jgi:hypothetical protein
MENLEIDIGAQEEEEHTELQKQDFKNLIEGNWLSWLKSINLIDKLKNPGISLG